MTREDSTSHPVPHSLSLHHALPFQYYSSTAQPHCPLNHSSLPPQSANKEVWLPHKLFQIELQLCTWEISKQTNAIFYKTGIELISDTGYPRARGGLIGCDCGRCLRQLTWLFWLICWVRPAVLRIGGWDQRPVWSRPSVSPWGDKYRDTLM